MPWQITEVNKQEKDILTDYELTKIIACVSHIKNNGYPEIALKLRHIASHAHHNIKSLQCWEDEGGNCGDKKEA